MKIIPLKNQVHLKIDEAKAGILDTSSRMSAVEYAEVLALGPDVTIDIKVGDHVFVKAWATDIITHEDKRYYFISTETNGILAIVR